MKLLDELKKLDLDEIREMIAKTEGKDRQFYADLYNKVLALRQKDVLENEKKYGHFYYLKNEKDGN